MSITRLLLLAGLMVFNLFFAQAQITVDFTADQTEGCGSLQVSFCDNSSSTAGNITSWSWSLGGVNSSTECPGRIFGSPGTYEICLTVTDSDGNTGSKCEDFITIHPLPEPDFVADQPEGCVPHTSTFTYTGTSNNIVEYVWGLDGSTGVVVTDGSAAPDAESTYSLVDEYAISLTVTDENGCENFISKPDVVTTFDPPAVLFHAEETFKCEPSFSVNFVNDSIQTNMTYTWDFGNNVTFVGPTPPPVLYSNAGSYTVTLIGTNGATACSDTLVLEDYITIGYVGDFSFTPAVGCQDLTVSFTDESVETADSVSWNFGDGSPLSTGANPNHVFENSGFYTVTLTRYIAGCATMKTATTQIEVLALPDVAYNNNNTLGCSLPHTVSFTGVSADAVSWEWDFGDSTTSNLQNPNHVYTEFGNYVVTLTVTNANGCENVLSTTTIEVVETEASLLNNEFSGCVPLNITLEDNSTTVIPLNSWLWEIDTPSGMLTSTDTFPNFNMVDTGCFDVVLTVTNILGCSDSRTFTDVICVGDNPLVNFEASPLQACVEQPVGFSDLSSPFVDFWYWDFGNDEESFQQNPENIYTDTGFYDITLIVSDKGCFGDTTLYDYIEVTEPKSRFRVEQNCSSPLYIELVNTSIGADSFFWDFGVPVMSTDTSSLMNPNFTYPDTGTYVVTLTSFNFSTTCVHEETRLI